MSREYPNRPWVGVGVVVWRGDKILLIRRGREPRKGEWGIPGGAQAIGEMLFETASREVREETGLDITPTGIITAIDSIWRDEAGRVQFHYSLIEIAAEWTGGKAAAASDAEDVRWVTPEEAAQIVSWDETLRVIALSAERRLYSEYKA